MRIECAFYEMCSITRTAKEDGRRGTGKQREEGEEVETKPEWGRRGERDG